MQSPLFWIPTGHKDVSRKQVTKHRKPDCLPASMEGPKVKITKAASTSHRGTTTEASPRNRGVTCVSRRGLSKCKAEIYLIAACWVSILQVLSFLLPHTLFPLIPSLMPSFYILTLLKKYMISTRFDKKFLIWIGKKELARLFFQVYSSIAHISKFFPQKSFLNVNVAMNNSYNKLWK